MENDLPELIFLKEDIDFRRKTEQGITMEDLF
jgi:hypothetical protein